MGWNPEPPVAGGKPADASGDTPPTPAPPPDDEGAADKRTMALALV